MIKFRKDTEKEFSEALLQHCQELVFFKSFYNWKAISVCLYKISDLLYNNDKNEEALDYIIKSMNYAKKFKVNTNQHKILLVKILISLYYIEEKNIWKEALKILKKTKANDDHFKLISIIVYAKNDLLDEAEFEFSQVKATTLEELYRFVSGLLMHCNGDKKTAAAAYFETLGLKKYYDPFIRRMCLFELNSIFSKNIIEKALNSKNYYNEIVIINEYTDHLDSDIIELGKKNAVKLMKRLNSSDKLSYCWFNSDFNVLFELNCIENNTKWLQQSILQTYDYGTKSRLFDALSEGILRFSITNNHELNTSCFFDENIVKSSHKFILTLVSGNDCSRYNTLPKIIKLFKSKDIVLVIIGVNCSEDSKKILTMLVNNVKSAKCFFSENNKKVSYYYKKILKLFWVLSENFKLNTL